MKSKWIIIGLIAALLLFALYGLLTSPWAIRFYLRALKQFVVEQTPYDLQIHHLSTNLFSTVQADGLVLTDTLHNERVSVGTLTLRYNLPSMLFGKIHLEQATAENITITMVSESEAPDSSKAALQLPELTGIAAFASDVRIRNLKVLTAGGNETVIDTFLYAAHTEDGPASVRSTLRVRGHIGYAGEVRPLTADALLSVEGHTIRVDSLAVSAGPHHLALSGLLEQDDGRIHATVQVDPADLDQRLSDLTPVRVTLTAGSAYDLQAWRATAAMQPFNFKGLQIDSMLVSLQGDMESFELQEIFISERAGGTLQGTGALQWGDTLAYAARLDLERWPVDFLADSLSGGDCSGQLTFNGTGMTLTAAGTLAVAPLVFAGDSLPATRVVLDVSRSHGHVLLSNTWFEGTAEGAWGPHIAAAYRFHVPDISRLPGMPDYPASFLFEAVQKDSAIAVQRFEFDDGDAQIRGNAHLTLGDTLLCDVSFTMQYRAIPGSGQLTVKYAGSGTWEADGELTEVPLQALEAWLPDSIDVLGVMSATFAANGTTGHREGSLRLNIEALSLNDVPFGNVSLHGALQDTTLTLSTATISGPVMELDIDGLVTLPLTAGNWRALSSSGAGTSIVLSHLAPGELAPLLPRLGQAAGMITGNLTWQGSLSQPVLHGTVNWDDASYTDSTSMDFAGDIALSFEGRTAGLQVHGQIEQSAIDINGKLLGTLEAPEGAEWDITWQDRLRTQGSFTYEPALEASCTFDIPSLQDVLEPLLPGLVSTGSAGGHFNLHRQNGRPAGALHIEALDVRSRLGRADSLLVSLLYDLDTVTASEARIMTDSGSVALTGTLELPWAMDSRLPVPGQMQGLLLFENFPLAPFVDTTRHFDGLVSGRLNVTGTPLQPELSGGLKLRNGQMPLGDFRESLTSIHGSLQFDGRKVVVDSMAGRIAGGTVQSSGQFTWEGGLSGSGYLESRVRNIRLTEEKHFQLRIDRGDFRLERSTAETRISGNARLGESRYTKNFDLNKVTGPAPPAPPASAIDDIRLDLTIEAPDNVLIDNNIAWLTLGADLNVSGTVGHPSVQGVMNAKDDGVITYLGKKFTLNRGNLRFDLPDKIDPMLDFEAEHTITVVQDSSVDDLTRIPMKTEYVITLRLTGRSSDPDPVQLASSPVLSPRETLLLLTLGPSGARFLSRNTTMANADFKSSMSNTLQQFSSAAIAGVAEQYLEDILGFDRVRIEGNLFTPGEGTGASLMAQRAISRRATLSYQTVLGAFHHRLIQLHFRLTRRLFLESETDEKSRSALDIKYIYRFK